MSSGGDGGDVDRRGDHAAGERGDHLLGGLHARPVLRLRRRRAEVRRDHDVVIALEQRVVGDRLAREHVERRTRHLAAVQRILERRVVDQVAARAVDHPHPVPALRERLRVQEAPRLRRPRQVDRDEVGLGVEVGGRLGPLRAELAEALRAHERVVGEDRASRRPARARRRAGRSGRSRARPASSRRPRRRRSATAPSAPPSATHAPAARCAPTPASTRSCAPPPPRCSTAAHWPR